MNIPVVFFAVETTTFDFTFGVFCADRADYEEVAIFSSGITVSSFSKAIHSALDDTGSLPAIISEDTYEL